MPVAHEAKLELHLPYIVKRGIVFSLLFSVCVCLWPAAGQSIISASSVPEMRPPKVPPLLLAPKFVPAPSPFDGLPLALPAAAPGSEQPPTAQPRGFTTADIGFTYFDLQTNASVGQTAWYNESNGRLFAVWNFVPELDPQLSLRGTGYNYFSGGLWQPMPQQRLENSRTGWPNILLTHDEESELILNHNLTFGVLEQVSRSPVITGAWQEVLAPFSGPFGHLVWWPRIVRGDNAFGNRYLHALALTLPLQQGGKKYQGMDGALLYYRSKDNGKTWDKTNVLISGIDSTQFARIRPDCYAIDAYQNNVAIVVGGYGNSLVLLLSPDNGLTWSKFILQFFPIPRFYDQITDTNGDGVAEWLDTNDGSLAVLIDKGGIVHVWAGYAQIYNDDTTDNTFSFNPYANGILYWNTSMLNLPMKVIAMAMDQTGDDSLAIGPLGFFNTGLATHPSAGTDAQGNLYLSYSAVNELGRDSDGKSVRHTYLVGATYGGKSWGLPYSVVAENTAEAIYGKLCRFNDYNVRLIYQKDYCAGISLTYGYPDPCNSGKINYMVYVEAPAHEVITQVPLVTDENSGLKLVPNPVRQHVQVLLPEPVPGMLSIRNLSGVLVWQQPTTGSASVQVDLSALPSGLYMVSWTTETSVLRARLVLSH